MDNLQAAVDRMLCGDHGWAPVLGDVIVGFTVTEVVWEGKPNLDGWDNVAERRVIAWFACFADADAFEEEARQRSGKHYSYEIHPIQVRRPTRRPVVSPEEDIGKPLRAIELDVEEDACAVG